MNIIRDDGILILKPRGAVCEYRPDSYQELIALTLEVIQANAKEDPLVLADLSEVTFMNSSGLAQLVQMHIGTMNRRGRFAIFGANRRVMAIIKIAHLDAVFQIHDTRADAEAALRSS